MEETGRGIAALLDKLSIDRNNPGRVISNSPRDIGYLDPIGLRALLPNERSVPKEWTKGVLTNL